MFEIRFEANPRISLAQSASGPGGHPVVPVPHVETMIFFLGFRVKACAVPDLQPRCYWRGRKIT
jgi:hypothetical protein